MAPSSAAPVTTVELCFDPACPWTWRTSRWLVDVTGRRGVSLRYRAFDLSNCGDLAQVPEQYRAALVASRAALRFVEAAHADGADELIGAWYTRYRTHVHRDSTAPSVDLVAEVLVAANQLPERFELKTRRPAAP